MKRLISIFIILSALLLALFANSSPVQASSCNWTGGHSIDWEEVQNWGCGHIPTSADDVTIPQGTTYSPSITNPEQVGNLTVSGHLTFGAQLSTSGWEAEDGAQLTGNFNVGGALVGAGHVSGDAVLYGQYDGVLTIDSGITATVQNITLVQNLYLNGTLDGNTIHMQGQTFYNNGHVKTANVYFDSQGIQHINGTGSWEQTISLLSVENGTTLTLDNNMIFQIRYFTTAGNGVNILNIGGNAITFEGSLYPDPNPYQLVIAHQMVGTGSIHTQANMALYITGTFAPDLYVNSGVTLAQTSIGFDGLVEVADSTELEAKASTIIANNNVINNGTIGGDGEFRMHGVQLTNNGVINVASFLLWQNPTPSFEQHIAGSGQWTGTKVDLSTFSYLVKLDNDVEMQAGEVDIYQMDLQGHTFTVDGSGPSGSTVILSSNTSSITGAGSFILQNTVNLQNKSAAGFSVPLIADGGTFNVNGFFNNSVLIGNTSYFTVPDGKTFTVGGFLFVNDNSWLHGGDLTTIELRGDTGYLGQDFDNSAGTTVLNASGNQRILGSNGLIYLFTKNLIVKAQNVTLELPAVRITGMLELDGALTIIKPDGLDWPIGVLLEETATTSGIGDVFGVVHRDGPFQLGKTYSFGNPNTTLTFDSGSDLPGYFIMVVHKSPTEGLLTSIDRSYTLTTTNGGGWTATLRLHYRDDEMRGMSEQDLRLWTRAESGDPWTNITPSHSDNYYDWLETSQGATGDWALTAKPRNYLSFIMR